LADFQHGRDDEPWQVTDFYRVNGRARCWFSLRPISKIFSSYPEMPPVMEDELKMVVTSSKTVGRFACTQPTTRRSAVPKVYEK
jgi:hypothetical protein